MSDSLGLSIGTANLVAARPGRAPVTRRSVPTSWENRPTEASIAEALDALARTVGDGLPEESVVVAVPAHWGPASVRALRGALRAARTVSPRGVPPTLVSDASTALVALGAITGLPQSGVVALCDFGASGTNITLADAGARQQLIGNTLRFSEFSGDFIDQALLNHVLASIGDTADPAGTAAVGSLTNLREQCRLAKERLSTETSTVVQAELPGIPLRHPDRTERARATDREAAWGLPRCGRGCAGGQPDSGIQTVRRCDRGRCGRDPGCRSTTFG